MTDEQFAKMYAVEVCKLRSLMSIENAVQALARKEGLADLGVRWDKMAEALSGAIANVEAQPRGAKTPK